jgi:hypothetical protein
MPSKFEIRIPSVIKSYVAEPNYPFNSIGTSSFIKLGINTEKAPAERPKMNLPVATTQMFLIRVMPQPIQRITLFPIIQFHFPNLIRGPENMAPIAAPKVHIAVIPEDQVLI